MATVVTTRVEDFVGVVSLNRPDKHNAIDDELAAQLLAAVEWAAGEPAVRVVLLRGEGRSFSSGRDTSVMGKRREGDSHFSHLRRSQQLNLRLAECPKPVVVALKGYVLGKALETALAGDIRVVARGAKLGFPEVAFGLATDNGGAPRTTALAGPARAKYLIMSGELVDADQAVAWGLAEWVVEPDELDTFAFDLARRLAAKPPLALAVAKEVVDQVDRSAVLNGTRTEAFAQIALMSTEDYQEARAARGDNRPPTFSGR